LPHADAITPIDTAILYRRDKDAKHTRRHKEHEAGNTWVVI
jgi:hypothetical protein